MRAIVDGPAFAALWVLALAGAALLGWALGRRRPVRAPGLYEGAVLGLCAALLAVGWLAAYQAHLWRASLVHDEADYLGQGYRFATLLPKEDRRWLRAHLLAYIDTKLHYLQEGGEAVTRTQPELVRLHLQIWDHLAALELANDYPRQQCLEALNRIIEVHWRRLYAYSERIPPAGMGLMALACLASAFLAGLTRARWAGLLTVTLLGLTFLSVHDLDQTLSGAVQTDYANLKNLRIYMFQDPE